MREVHTVTYSRPCESCGRNRFEAGKVLVGSFCASCDAKIEGPWSMAFRLPCGHEALHNAVMRTKDILRCLNCSHVRDYAGS